MLGVAVKVFEAPEHVGLEPELKAMLTLGAIAAVMVMVKPFDVAVVGEGHVALDVITQVTTCPLVNEDEVNVALLVPALVPFTCH